MQVCVSVTAGAWLFTQTKFFFFPLQNSYREWNFERFDNKFKPYQILFFLEWPESGPRHVAEQLSGSCPDTTIFTPLFGQIMCTAVVPDSWGYGFSGSAKDRILMDFFSLKKKKNHSHTNYVISFRNQTSELLNVPQDVIITVVEGPRHIRARLETLI